MRSLTEEFSQELLEDFTENCINVISLPYEKLPFGEICALRDMFHILYSAVKRWNTSRMCCR